MAIDIYGKQRELQEKYNQQQKRLQENENRWAESQKTANQGNATKLMFGAGTRQDSDYEKAKGAYDAEKHAANVELSNLQPQLQEEEKRVSAVKPLAELQEKQEMRAKEFRQAFPSILDSKLGAARTESRRKIAEGVNTARAGYNQRGLLYSGLRAGAEADVSRDAESELADTAVKTNQELMDQANELDQDAINTGLKIGDISSNLDSTNSQYRQAIIDSLMQQDLQRQQAIGGLLGSGAQLAGLGLGAGLK